MTPVERIERELETRHIKAHYRRDEATLELIAALRESIKFMRGEYNRDALVFSKIADALEEKKCST